MKPRILLNIVLSVAVLVVMGFAVQMMLAHRRQPTQRKRPKATPKVLAPPIKATLNRNVEIAGYGSARPHVQLTITPQVTGIVVAKDDSFLSGKYVRKGQVLCRIDRTDYDLAVRRAESRIDLLKAQLARLEQEQKNLTESKKIETDLVKLADEQLRKVKRLLEANAGSENEVDLARETLLSRQRQLQGIVSQLALIGPQRKQLAAELASAGVELSQARVNLGRCTIKSPVTGRVLTSRVEVGQLVQAGGNCGEIFGSDIMEVPVSVPAAELEWLDKDLLNICKHGNVAAGESRRLPAGRQGIKALVEWRQSDNGRTLTWTGCLERLEAGLEAQTRTATLIVRVHNPQPKLPDDTKPMLEVNMFCKVTVIGRAIPEVYVIPREAVLSDGGVYVVVEGRLRKRAVKVARFTGQEALILPGGGISAGDRVVTGSIAKPVVGMKVKPVGKTPKVPSATTKPGKKAPAS